jgi:hypothetical protein
MPDICHDRIAEASYVFILVSCQLLVANLRSARNHPS